MPSCTELLMAGWQQNQQQAEALLADVSAELMTRQPAGALNHPAWTLAHLIHYHPAIVSLLRGEAVADPANAPDADRYDAGSQPADDPSQYPDKQALLDGYRQGHANAASLLETVEDHVLTQPPGLPRWATAFGTTQRVLVYLMLVHEATHLGQIMAWRRAMGWPPVE